MKYYQLAEAEPEEFRFPNDEGPEAERENKRDPFIWFADACTVIVLSPVLIPVAIVYGIIYLIRRRHDT